MGCEMKKSKDMHLGITAHMLDEKKSLVIDEHDYIIGFMKKGEGKLVIEGAMAVVSKDQFFFISPQDVQMSIELEEKAICQLLYIKKSMADDFVADITAQRKPLIFIHMVAQDCTLQKKFQNIYHFAMRDCAAIEMEEEELLILFFACLIDNHSALTVCENVNTKYHTIDDKLRIYQELIQVNCLKKFLLKDVGELLNDTRAAILFAFIKKLGISPYQFLMSAKVNQAQKMLKKMGAEEVAQRTGFSSASYFKGVFQSMVGIAPDDFRQAYISRKIK